MTIVVAVKCPDGVVLATDSQATTQMPGNIPMKLPTKKIVRLGKYAVYGGTGGQGAGQRIRTALEAHAAKMGNNRDAADIGEVIRRTVNPIQHEVHKEWVQIASSQPEVWGGIFCGWAKDGPWIFEVDVSGPSQFQDPFAATGSGHPLAHTALMSVAHFDVASQSLEAAKAIAYRAVENTCDAAAYGVGMPVQMAVVTKDGVEELSEGDEAHSNLSDLVDLWKAKEVETLGGLAPQATLPPAAAPAAPEPSLDETDIEAGETQS